MTEPGLPLSLLHLGLLHLSLLDAALRGALLITLLLLVSEMRRRFPLWPASRVGTLMALGLCVQVVSATPWFEAHVPWAWQAPAVAVSVGNAALFWVFVQALFMDDFKWTPWHVAAWLAVVLLTLWNCATGWQHAHPVGLALQRAVPLVFAVLAVLTASRQWQSDLVESRRRLRRFIVVTGTAYTLAMLALRLASPRGRLSDASSMLDVALLLVIVGGALWKLLRLQGFEFVAPEASTSTLSMAAPTAKTKTAPSEAHDEPLVLALHQLMTLNHVYRSEDLTVASLAQRLKTPEYRLRRVINQRLGHRNFNAFVNGYRIDETKAALANPAQSELPILSIALESGFQSIGPFNRAFKAATGVTPSEFRRANLRPPNNLTIADS
jgi:AraC-like DNA-binding protein